MKGRMHNIVLLRMNAELFFYKEIGNKIISERLNINVKFVWLNLKVRPESHSLKMGRHTSLKCLSTWITNQEISNLKKKVCCNKGLKIDTQISTTIRGYIKLRGK